jgi:hypothetical protein
MNGDIIKNNNQQNLKPVDTANPLTGIEIPKGLKDELLVKTFGESVLTEIPFINKISEFLQSYKNKLDDARLLILLTEFKNKHETTEKFQSQLKRLITTPSGISLFQKVVRIINIDVFDVDCIKLFATALKKVSDSDLDKLFDKHNYVLSQIEKLSPQALFLLHDKPNWPTFNFSSTTLGNQVLGEGWAPAFVKSYFNAKRIVDDNKIQYGAHAVRELVNNSFVKVERDRLVLTGVGESMYEYIG